VKTARVLIAGEFEDVQLYMGHLLLWTTSGSVRVLTLRSIAATVDERNASGAPLGELLFARNDLLEYDRRGSPLRTQSARTAFLERLAKLPSDLSVSTAQLPSLEFSLEMPMRVLLDTTVYNGRVYMAADSGLFHVDAGWDEGAFEWGNLQKRHDARCIATSARYGSISVSCEEEGLFASFDDFGVVRSAPRYSMKKVAEKSTRTGWWQTSLLNYVTPTLADVFETQRERIPSGARFHERERSVVLSARLDKRLGTLLELVQSELAIAEHDVAWVGNSQDFFFLGTFDGRLLTMRVSIRSDGVVSLAWSKEYEDFQDRVVASYPSAAGLVLEGSAHTAVFTNGKFVPLFAGDAVAIRTFMNSRWYRYLVAVVGDDGVLLTALVPDPLPRRTRSGKRPRSSR
jgi:hypothetical protein